LKKLGTFKSFKNVLKNNNEKLELWNPFKNLFSTGKCHPPKSAARGPRPQSPPLLRHRFEGGLLTWCDCFDICYTLSNQRVFFKYVIFSLLTKSLLPDEMASRAVVWRPWFNPWVGKHFLWRATLKTLLLPGPHTLHLSTSVTIYASKYDSMIILL